MITILLTRVLLHSVSKQQYRLLVYIYPLDTRPIFLLPHLAAKIPTAFDTRSAFMSNLLKRDRRECRKLIARGFIELGAGRLPHELQLDKLYYTSSG